jgi:hypothetical protein
MVYRCLFWTRLESSRVQNGYTFRDWRAFGAQARPRASPSDTTRLTFSEVAERETRNGDLVVFTGENVIPRRLFSLRRLFDRNDLD